LRCLILPIGYAIFLATAQVLFNRINNYGLGTSVPIDSLQRQFDGQTKLVWADGSSLSSPSYPTPKDVIDRITANFTSTQLAAVKEVKPGGIDSECPQNWNGVSPCFAAIEFSNIPNTNGSLLLPNLYYTIYADLGLGYINVQKHTSDMEKRILPLQWEVDKVASIVKISLFFSSSDSSTLVINFRPS
jgi:hypothetical protein